MDRQNQTALPGRGRPVSGMDVAIAIDYFEHFLNATSLKNILGYHRSICEHLNLKPNAFPHFYPKLKGHLTSWRAKALWKKFDARAIHKCYGKGKLCSDTRVLIIGGGPCGMRTAIEAQLLGAKVVVIEKRDRFSRNNVLHLWPFVIEDLRMLGAKKFFGKFCAGAIDHISIRQLQCILLKVALLLGVEVHTEVSFEGLIEPNSAEKTGWRAEFSPSNHPVSQYEFDVIIGADGKRNTLQGFKRKEFRGKLAIAITANFINKRSEAEARVEEISGVAFIFNQKFFKDLHEATGIDLENIVYYKDDTHYFVMTAKKTSLIEKGVIKQDLADTERLLALDNVNKEALMNYATEAANFSTNYQLPDLEFAVNHYGLPDVAMFDFTSMYAAENASKIVERNGYPLLMILVGDSLLEPFWPTGSGCARGFLSSLDAAWAIRSWSSGTSTALDVLAERESIYRLLAQTTPDNLNKDWKAYTLDPTTRYPNLNKNVVMATQVVNLFDTDNPSSIEKMKKNVQEVVQKEISRKRRRGNVDTDVLLKWISKQVREHDDIEVTNLASVFRNGKVLCAILNHYRPDLVDYIAIKDDEPTKNNQLAIDIFEKEIGISPIMTGEEITNTDDYLSVATYLTQVYDRFRCEIPHIKHPKLELPESKRSDTSLKSFKFFTHAPHQNIIQPPSRPSSRHKRHVDVTPPNYNKQSSIDRKTRKRRTLEKLGASVEERQRILEEIASNRSERQNKRRQQRKLQTEQFIKSMQMLQANAKSDSQPFEDYAIFLYRQTAPNFEDRVKDLEKKFTYVPDPDSKLPNQTRTGNADEDLAARIRNFEDKWREPEPVEKKPKDLLRAIGKIETSDWNIKEIEKKIKENKLGKPTNKDKEKVPKWSKEQFIARQTKMEKQHLDRQNSTEAKFADIDRNIKHLELKLKEGTARDLGGNKVASITEKLSSKIPENPELQLLQKSQSRTAVVLPTQGGSEFCHFCSKRVYLMERLSAEGKFFHHGCFKCQYCNTQLRLGSYAYDRDGLYDHKFFCIHHYGMQGECRATKIIKKNSHRAPAKGLEKLDFDALTSIDLLDRVKTPERIEFSNLSIANASSEHEDSLSQMDEDEWTDKNFGASAAELGSSDDESSSLSETDSDDEDVFEEALEEPATKEGTLKWAERFNKRYSKKKNDSASEEDYSSSDLSSYYENSSDDDESDTATEGEEEIRARELRRQEVRVEPPVVQTDTGTDTEVVSDETTSESSSEIRNSATEISTDSEFAHDEPTPTREIPPIALNDAYITKHRGRVTPTSRAAKCYNEVTSKPYDMHVTKTRGSSSIRKIQVTSAYLQKPINGQTHEPDIELKLTPLVPSSCSSSAPVVRKPAPNLLPRTEGYALNRTQSTGGIAAKVSLELKKKYLLGEANGPGSIQKSGSASTLYTKLKSFETNITDCQKMLRPAPEISASMQTFCSKMNERSSPILSPQFPNKVLSDATSDVVEKPNTFIFQNEPEDRPRSPVHETSIIVPQINWNESKGLSQSEDSLSLSENDAPKLNQFNIPTVEISVMADEDNDEVKDDDIPLDSLCLEAELKKSEVSSTTCETIKSTVSDRKTLNQPKPLPILERSDLLPEIHLEHVKNLDIDKESPENEVKSVKSGRSTPSNPDSIIEQATAALTETELSDWARDGIVSDDLEEDFEFNRDSRKNKTPKTIDGIEAMDKTKIVEMDSHVCGKDTQSDIFSKNLESMEFMDTGSETSSEDGARNSQHDYELLKNEDDLQEHSLKSSMNNPLETKNPILIKPDFSKNTGYCVLASDADFQLNDVEKLKNKPEISEPEEDSLLILEMGTTTEDNTCSDSTVKNITELPDISHQPPPPMTGGIQRLENKLAQIKAESKSKNLEEKLNPDSHVEFDEHCQRLQLKVEFSNAKDSIDVRKSRRRSKPDINQKPDLIQEEKESSSSLPGIQDVTLKLSPVVRTPDILYKKEFIEKERDVNQKLIQEMVMSKMKAENKSLERKKRNRNANLTSSPNHSFELKKSATSTDVILKNNKRNVEVDTKNSFNSKISLTPDVLFSTNFVPLQKSQTTSDILNGSLEVFSTSVACVSDTIKPLNLFDKVPESSVGGKDFFCDEFKTPIAPPRTKHEEAKRTAEKLKQEARNRARLLTNEELGLSPEEKLAKLREKIGRRNREKENSDLNIQESIESLVVNTEKRNSWLYSNDTLNRKKNSSFRRSNSNDCATADTTEPSLDSKSSIDILDPNVFRAKSNTEICGDIGNGGEQSDKTDIKVCKSDPNLLDTDCKKSKKKSKDRERRKSITKLFTNLFTKRTPNSTSKSIFSKISPKTKNLSKEALTEEPKRRRSFSEEFTHRNHESPPPPIPPLPLNYTNDNLKYESSDAETDQKRYDRSSCDTLDQSGNLEYSVSSMTNKRNKAVRKVARQAQLKRHRMAQEIQRKLEETEVKMRELEERGVAVEKALRGENGASNIVRDETELFQEWFDLMRDRTELRRYEKELTARAQELELEDRYARLQHDLRERLENNEQKSHEDVEIEGSIINEMMEIVAKRDSLNTVLEEDRLRYSHEDRDFEEQMLAKGLRLTPIRKGSEK